MQLFKQDNERIVEELTATLATLRRENLRLMQDLIDSQRANNNVLRAALTEQHVLRQLMSPTPPEPILSKF